MITSCPALVAGFGAVASAKSGKRTSGDWSCLERITRFLPAASMSSPSTVPASIASRSFRSSMCISPSIRTTLRGLSAFQPATLPPPATASARVFTSRLLPTPVGAQSRQLSADRNHGAMSTARGGNCRASKSASVVVFRLDACWSFVMLFSQKRKEPRSVSAGGSWVDRSAAFKGCRGRFLSRSPGFFSGSAVWCIIGGSGAPGVFSYKAHLSGNEARWTFLL